MGSMKRVAVICGLSAMFMSVAQAEDWKVAKEADGIKVSLSEVSGSNYKAYQGVTTIKAPLAKVRALQEDVAEMQAQVQRCSGGTSAMTSSRDIIFAP